MEAVAHSRHGPDIILLLPGVPELQPQLADVPFEQAGILAAVRDLEAPDAVHQGLIRQHLPWVPHQLLQELEFGSGQAHMLLAPLHLPPLRVQYEVAGAERLPSAALRSAVLRRSPEQRLDLRA